MLMSMGLVKGTELTIIAEGEDEAAAREGARRSRQLEVRRRVSLFENARGSASFRLAAFFRKHS